MLHAGWNTFKASGLAVAFAAALGCSKDNAVSTGIDTQGAIGQQCKSQGGAGCGTSGVCVLGWCRLGCATDAECPQGTLCVGDVAPFGCQLDQDKGCNATDRRCKAGLVCGIDANCRTPCNATTTCPRNEQECIQGTCVGKGESGALSTWFSCTTGATRCGGADGVTMEVCNVAGPGWVASPDGTQSSCVPLGAACQASGSKCADPGAVCVLGYCRMQCVKDSECPQGAICVGDKDAWGCQLPQDAACSSSKPCSAPLVCALDATCRIPCAETKDCPRNDQQCHAGVCVGDSEKSEAAAAYRSCKDGEERCGTQGEICSTGACHVEACNVTAPGWGVVQECTGQAALCVDAKCVAAVAPEAPGALVHVPYPGGGTTGIDATEVTRAQYLKFVLEHGSDTSGQPSECLWNTDYVPAGDWPPLDRPHHPVTDVDWCDAFAYCAWAGKRLCGQIGGGPSEYFAGGMLPDWSMNQWVNACTSGGKHAYPYGDTYDGNRCSQAGSTTEVKASPGCQSYESGYAGVYDLIGNVWEWEDACDGQYGASDRCAMRGGSHTNSNFMDCNNPGGQFRNWGFVMGYEYHDVGFRCCSNP